MSETERLGLILTCGQTKLTRNKVRLGWTLNDYPPLDACGLAYLPSRRIKSKSPTKELFAVLCTFRTLRVLINVRAEINTSNSADASHAIARSECRTTNFFQSFEPQGGERGTYDSRCYVRLKREKKVEKSVNIMAMNVRFLWHQVTTAGHTVYILRVSPMPACH